ncbi:aspartyl-tRNA synthetase, putative [Babesia bigemina]|uniref:aspartate--tRNA ligase n=1 Tax=Babesia bigemina TaxID=5866 RepID=A0A061DCW8_BABBI|nr:aspartyl-tRNA synthetase, putative [Babesia bigemina]CDR98052.1 aspartyl-tRNA synthetase, putative [Babesia bigemina]|eukprot:XP_012770238.1 aspartyl-tRNA synthetase, putative [Babesia bigemina]
MGHGRRPLTLLFLHSVRLLLLRGFCTAGAVHHPSRYYGTGFLHRNLSHIPNLHSLNMDKRQDNIEAAPVPPANPKEDAKQARLRAREEQERQKLLLLETTVSDLDSTSFGYLSPTLTSLPARNWVDIKDVDDAKDQLVWIRGRINDVRGKGAMCFIILRQQYQSLQCIVDSRQEMVSKDMVKWSASLSMESIVDVFGKVVVPDVPVASTTAKCELQVHKIFCVSKATPTMPFLIRDANNTDDEEACKNPNVIKVNQDTRLDNRPLDLRATLNLAIFKIQSEICQQFRNFLIERQFIEIHSPKLLGGTSEGGCNVFKLKYFDNDACLAQSPQLYKQLAVVGDFRRVFEIGPVFRAENSNTHRHLCEFVGLDMEMEFKDSYMEVVDMIDDMLKSIFEGVTKQRKEEMEIFGKMHPSVEPLKWLEQTPRLRFTEAVEMLRGTELASEIPDDISSYDFSTEQEKRLGRLVREKYNTDYYIIYEYPLNARPFYTMPLERDGMMFTHSYDFFMRGEEILSGAQRIHNPELLLRRAKECGIDPKTISSYIEAFKMGVSPHAGCGIGLERVAMLLLGTGNIRKTSLFPRDPRRLTP